MQGGAHPWELHGHHEHINFQADEIDKVPSEAEDHDEEHEEEDEDE
jgi:hypothetical protein